VITSVFVHRFRDIAAHIRADSIHFLGEWLQKCAEFLDPTHLKYLGWLLNDRDSMVRESALQTISHLCEADPMVDDLVEFLQRFKTRLLEMSRDVDDRCRVLAMSVCAAMFR
jgi:cohesin complex subunit SA-1/2